MEKHGSESYFILGEGLLAESGDGRDRSRPPPAAARRRSASRRMGPKGTGRQLGEPNRTKLGALMAAGGGGDVARSRPGFTYLGQFIDHDLTFDKTNVMLGANVIPAALLQARSPSLDLDSLYGAGPQDPESAKFYEADGMHLKMGKTVPADGIPAKNGFDLPRGAGSPRRPSARRSSPTRATTRTSRSPRPTSRWSASTTACSTRCRASVPAAQKFATARELVTKHYQWMIRTDYLPRVCAPSAVDNVFNQGRKVFEVGATPTDVPTMPIEFRIAAFRLGHSMVRTRVQLEQDLRRRRRHASTSCSRSPPPAATSAAGVALPSNWIADFRRLYDFKEAGHTSSACRRASSTSPRRSTPGSSNPLGNLPAGRSAGRASRAATRARTSRSATSPVRGWSGSRPVSRWRRS